MRVVSVVAVAAVMVAVNFGLWAVPNQPVPVPSPPGGKLRSVSFAPFRDGQSPLAMVFPTRQQIDDDLRVLADQVAGVRTYTSQEGLEAVPELARSYGLTVTMGAWLGSVKLTNENEVAAVIRLANRYPDVIRRVIVGNEVLLRNDLSYDQLVSYIRRVKSAVKQPVGYADVWEYWLKYPAIADEVDYVTIHLLPYWEDIPAGIEDAAAHVLWVYGKIAERFPGKPILVGETGWPTAGRSRGPAVPGLVEKARFDSTFIQLAERYGFDYNLIEAFDQSWKIRLEGTVGGHWGLYDSDRHPKFQPGEPVVENPGWLSAFVLSSALALGVFGLLVGFGPPLAGAGLVGTAALVQGLAAGLVFSAAGVAALAYYLHDVAFGWAMVAGEAAAAAGLVAAVVVLLSGQRPAWAPTAAKLGNAAWHVLTVVAVIWTLLLIGDGRYRCFPIPHYLALAFGIAVLAVLRLVLRSPDTGATAALSARRLLELAPPALPPVAGMSVVAAAGAARFEAACAALAVLGAIALVVSEGVVNREAVIWAGLLVVLALPYAAAVASLVAGSDGRRPAVRPEL
ncbi:MAG: glycoside hydrolase [Azospirillum sp.]|nr:glycoside hydrolase [Azospirillum sp.]